jgi:hypothetical protein
VCAASVVLFVCECFPCMSIIIFGYVTRQRTMLLNPTCIAIDFRECFV